MSEQQDNPRSGLGYDAAKERDLPQIDFTRAMKVTPEVQRAITDAFDYRAWDEEKTRQALAIREALIGAVVAIVNNAPPGPDRAAAIRRISEARMAANSAITHGGRY